MTQYKTLNVKLSNSQLNKLKSRIKNGIALNLYLSSNVIGDSNDETNFPHKLLFTDKTISLKSSATDAAVQEKNFESGMTTPIISKRRMKDHGTS